jgi:hypothetical protein
MAKYKIKSKKLKEKKSNYVEKSKWKMGIYKDGELVDFGVYDTEEEAEADFQNYDKPKGRTHIIEQE